MTKNEVEFGSVYLMRHGGRMVQVRILREKESRSFSLPGSAIPSRTLTHWIAMNLSTGRLIEIKSATRLIRKVAETD